MNRTTMILPAFLVLLLCAGGCSRRVPLSALEAGGAEVGVRIVTSSGESVEGLLLLMDDDAIMVEAEYAVGGELSIRGIGDRRTLYSGDDPVPGELVRVERRDGRGFASVRRAVSLDDVVTATFHRSRREASLSPIVSAVLGPLVGASLALIL